MVVIGIGVGLGLFVGWFSFAFQKLFLAFFASVGGLLFLFSRQALMLFHTATGAAGPAPATPMAAFTSLPGSIQNAVAFAVIAGFAGRIATWGYCRFLKPEAGEESRQDMRARVLREYGMADPLG